MTSGDRAADRPRSDRPGRRPGDVTGSIAGSSCAALALLTGCIGVPNAPVGANELPAPAAALPEPARSSGPPAAPVMPAPRGSMTGLPGGSADGSIPLAASPADIDPLFEGPIPGLVFAKNRASLDDTARAALAPLVDAMQRHPDVVVVLQGHTDNRGPAGGNLALSKRRVMAVVRFLVAEGVDPNRLQPWGYGENRPVAVNATAEGRARNRRIEVRAIMPRHETGR